MSWLLTILAFVISRPLGIILLLIKAIRSLGKKPPKPVPRPQQRPPEKREPEKAVSESYTPTPKEATGKEQEQHPVTQQAPVKNDKNTVKPSRAPKVLRSIGAIMMILSSAGALALVVNEWPDHLPWQFTLPLLLCFLGGIAMYASGFVKRKRNHRIMQYVAAFGGQEAVHIDELVSLSGKSRGIVTRDITYMLEKGLYGQGAFFDSSRDMLFKNADAFRGYADGQVEDRDIDFNGENSEYYDTLLAIRKANDRITDPAFSKRLERIEQITAQIFRKVEEHPEKQQEIKRFFDYYLPTTLKLLDTYIEFQDSRIDSGDMSQTKAKIEKIMLSLQESFERQLDILYGTEIMDVEAEIRVMEIMIRRDLSSVEQDFGTK